MIDAQDLRYNINCASAEGADFLFGIDFEMSRGFFVEKPKEQQNILWRVGEHSNFVAESVSENKSLEAYVESLESYNARFKIVKDGLMRGDSFLTNLTLRTAIEIDYTLPDIVYRCNSPYALLLPDRFVCFSPEPFVKICGGVISSYPMKGTIDADIENAERVVLSDHKETAEHNTIVDLIRSDLSRVATAVGVDRFRYIDRLNTSRGDILQVSSKISGQLPHDYKDRLGDILFELLPAGSVSGAPKHSTLNIIKRAEAQDRGYYCGVFGYFDGRNLNSAVMIRFIEQNDGNLYFRSGSGVTINSSVEYEYQEVIRKIYLPF